MGNGQSVIPGGWGAKCVDDGGPRHFGAVVYRIELRGGPNGAAFNRFIFHAGEHNGRRGVANGYDLLCFRRVSARIGHHKRSNQVVTVGAPRIHCVDGGGYSVGRAIVCTNGFFQHGLLVAAVRCVFRNVGEVRSVNVRNGYGLGFRHRVATQIGRYEVALQNAPTWTAQK